MRNMGLPETLDLDDLERGGTAFLTPTVLSGRVALRVCFTNHRTTSKDSDELLRALREIGKRGLTCSGRELRKSRQPVPALRLGWVSDGWQKLMH